MIETSEQILFETITILFAAVSVLAVFYRMKISPVLAYFAAGAVIGAQGLSLVQSHAIIDLLGEFGIVFLLFLIGLELTFERLIAMRSHVFGLGGIQVTLTTMLVTLAAYYYGLNLKVSIIIGGGLALSSTAIVFQLLQEKQATSTEMGRLSIAILLLQDLAVIPLLVLVPLLVPDSSNSLFEPILQALTKAIFAFIIIFVTGRLIARPFFNMVAATKNDELFIATILLIILGTSYITSYLNLPMELGAFCAGLLIAETEHCHKTEQVILPFKKLLLGLFFMAIGMSINWHLLSSNLPLIITLSLVLMAMKAAIIISLSILFKCKKESAIKAGFVLAQGGEFAFILFNLESTQTMIPHDVAQILMAVVTTTMALTPVFSYIGSRIAKALECNKNTKTTEQLLDLDTTNIDQHVVIAGFGRAGQMIAKMLDAEQVSYVGLDIKTEIVERSESQGYSIYLGDATDIKILKATHLERARAIIISISDKSVIQQSIKIIKEHFPNLKIIVRLSDLSNATHYYNIGADKLVPETYEVGLQLGAAILTSIGFNETYIATLKDRFRKGGYTTAKSSEYDL